LPVRLPANGWSRRRWAAAILGSLIAHALALGVVHFGAVPASNADDVTAPIAILRITRLRFFARALA
jgi:hypothetical protein